MPSRVNYIVNDKFYPRYYEYVLNISKKLLKVLVKSLFVSSSISFFYLTFPSSFCLFIYFNSFSSSSMTFDFNFSPFLETKRFDV